MGAYAIKAKPKIDELLNKNECIVIDGLYSWEEYTYLKKHFPFLKLILILIIKKTNKTPLAIISRSTNHLRDSSSLLLKYG